jgi:serine/threonine protein kinase/tetratricopeptide (TPR) repeat protein
MLPLAREVASQMHTKVGPYSLLRELGTGGMGVVYLAEDSRLGRRVALKSLSMTGADARSRLLHEARSAGSLNHRNIATVYDVLDTGDEAHIVMEYVEGEPLSRRLADGPMDPLSVCGIGTQLASGLAAAHARGVVHRDLKPGNVQLCPDGTVKILDFGIAKHLFVSPAVAAAETMAAEPATAPGHFIGTREYASPEQLRGRAVDHRTDLYSLGLILAELATGGRTPSQRKTAKMPAPLADVIARSTAEHPDDRYYSADEMFAALNMAAMKMRSQPTVSAWRRRLRRSAAAAVVFLAALAALPWLRERFMSSPAAATTVAVLPFANLSGDSSNEHLGPGIAESLTIGLASLPALTVVSRDAAREAAEGGRDARRVAQNLGVSYVVDGTIQQSGDRVLVTASLLRSDAVVAWADSFEGSRGKIFELQETVVTAVLRAIEATVNPGARDSEGSLTKDRIALERYWQGRALLERRDRPENVREAIAGFEEAVKHDPSFALAYAGLGEAYWLQYSDSREQVDSTRAQDAAREALRLDPDNATVRYSAALTYKGVGDTERAINELRRALALRPRYDDARRVLGDILASRGLIDEAVAEYQKAIAVRPRYWEHHRALGNALYDATRYADAAKAFEEVIRIRPDNRTGYQNLGTALQAMGRVDDALRNYQLANEREPAASTFANIGTLFYERGDFKNASESYRKAVDMRPNNAALHRNLGDALRRQGAARDAEIAYARAVALLQSELRVNPNNPRTLASLAVYQAKLGRRTDADATARRAEELSPDDAQVLFRCAVTYALVNDPKTALTYLRQALDKGFDRATASAEEDLESLRTLAEFKALVNAPPRKGP